MSNWNKRIRAAREAQKMTREMVVQKMQQFLPESEKAVSTRSLISWEAGEREPRVTVGVALAKALNEERIAGAGIDVFEMEPPVPAEHPLLHSKHTVVTPHVAFASHEALFTRAQIVSENILKWEDGKPQNVIC